MSDEQAKRERHIAALVGHLGQLMAVYNAPGAHDGLVALLREPQHGAYARAILEDAIANLGSVLTEVDAHAAIPEPDNGRCRSCVGQHNCTCGPYCVALGRD
jgi:hypothetical protein